MKNNIAILITGFGIGIFLGLSDSPILLQILVPLLTVIVGFLSIFTGQKNFESSENNDTNLMKLKNLNALPIMWMVVGMVLGSIPGMLARNYHIFSPKEIRQQLIQRADSTTAKISASVLHGVSKEQCENYKLCKTKGIDLVCRLNDIGNPEIDEYLSKKEINLDSVKAKITKLCNCTN